MSFRVGIIGAGSIAQRAHIPGWQAVPGVQVVALCVPDPGSAESVAKIFGIAQIFSDYRELLKLDLDAVSICVPNALHFSISLAALQSGKHVLCEKPLALTANEVKLLGEESEKARRLLMTQHQLRFGAPARASRAWVIAGNLGLVYHAQVKALRHTQAPVSPGFIDKELSGGGPAMDIGVHSLDIALWLMNFPKPVRVTGNMRTNFDHGKDFSVEDFAAGFVHFENGATMTIEASWSGHYAEPLDMSCSLFGLEGSLHWPSGEYYRNNGEMNSTPVIPTIPFGERSHSEAIRAFHDAICTEKPSPIPWRETYWVIAIIEALYRSAKEGREILIPE